MREPFSEVGTSRREWLSQAGVGFGALALHAMLHREACGSVARSSLDTAAIKPTADAVIFLFLEGGPSHLDTFDPKPKLEALAGQPLPESFGPIITPMGEYRAPLFPSQRRWHRHGESGIVVSDWLPEIGKHADKLAVLRGCWADGLNHSNGVCQMNTGAIVAGRPSLGSWIRYGLGSANDSLPSFVVIEDAPGKVLNGARNWGAGFMPASLQGVPLRGGEEPIGNLRSMETLSDQRRQDRQEWLQRWDQRHLERHDEDDVLKARIDAYELACRMQSSAPEAVDLSKETSETHRLYGMDDEATRPFGEMCLLARRLVERGVRFVQLYHGSGSRWDAHADLERNHSNNCRASDRPVAGLLEDLHRRGLLERTLVVWGGEFGRTPMSEKGNGRDHNPYGFTMWMAGGGVVGGRTWGSTDELGLKAIEDRLHVLDLHATILHAVGLDPLKLTYLHEGRPERPTLNTGRPFTKVFAG